MLLIWCGGAFQCGRCDCFCWGGIVITLHCPPKTHKISWCKIKGENKYFPEDGAVREGMFPQQQSERARCKKAVKCPDLLGCCRYNYLELCGYWAIISIHLHLPFCAKWLHRLDDLCQLSKAL